MTKIDFTEVIEIVVKGEESQSQFKWDLGDALIKVVGHPNLVKVNDGSFAKLEALSQELSARGYDYDAYTLRNIRWVASTFPARHRIAEVSWTAHVMAGSPQTLTLILEAAPRAQKLTARYVQKQVKALALARQQELALERSRRQEAHDEARREIQAAEAKRLTARTDAERRAAESQLDAAMARQEKFKNPPTMQTVTATAKPPQKEDMPALVARAAFSVDFGHLERAVRKLVETYEDEMLSVFTEADFENGHEVLMTIIEIARGFAQKLRANKGSHLSVVADNAG